MSDRHEPTISSLPLDKGEAQSRGDNPRSRSQNPAPGYSASREHVPAAARTVTVRSPLGPIALALALAALALSGYLFWQTRQAQDKFEASLAHLTTTEKRVVELESKLSMAGDESTQSMAVLQANVKENASEIRKLWGVSNDRNRKAIEELKATSTRLSKSLQEVDSNLKKNREELSGEIKVIADLVDAQQSAIAKVDRAFTSQSKNITGQLEKIDSLETDMRRRMTATEEAIRSIDAFRAQINREIMQIKGG